LFDGVDLSSDLVEHLVVGARLHRGAGGPLVCRGGLLLGEEAMEQTLDGVQADFDVPRCLARRGGDHGELVD